MVRFYTTDSNGYWKQCKYCGAFCQLIIDGVATNRSMVHHGDCAVLAFEDLVTKVNDLLPLIEISNHEPAILEEIARINTAIRFKSK